MTFKAQLIKYIHQLPIPESVDAVSKLTQADVLELAPVLVGSLIAVCADDVESQRSLHDDPCGCLAPVG